MDPRVLQHEVTGEGEPIVLVPGILSGWVSWIPHAERLAKTNRVVRVQPIHSELAVLGELPPPTFDWRTERESLRLTLDELGIDRADFAAWSGGGRAMIEFSARYPERVRTLTLIEPAAYWVVEQSDPDGRLPHWDPELTHRLARKRVTEEDLVEFLGRAGIGGGGDLRAMPQWPVWLQNRNALASDEVLGWPDRRIEALRSVTAPVLIVYGDVTEPWLQACAVRLGELYPNARVVELPGDHACHIQSIDRFLDSFEKHTATRSST